MPGTRTETDALSAAVLRRIRQRMLAQSEATLEELDNVYAQVARDLQEELRGVTSPVEIRRIATERMAAALSEALPVIQANVIAGAVAGATTPEETFAAIFPSAPAPRFPARVEAQRAAADVLRGRIQARDVPLARRLRENHERFVGEMTREIETSLHAGESAWNTMERILDVREREGVVAELPQYMQRLRDAAHDGGPAFQREMRDVRAYAQRLGSIDGGNTSVRAATEEVLKRLEDAKTEDIDGIIARWAEDKAQYQAKVIARTERIAAHRAAYERSMRDKPWVKGFKWALSGASHPRPDICDLLANQNLHGLGPGGYPVNAVPATPHPNCTCTQTAILDQDHFERELAQLDGTPPPRESWNVGGFASAGDWLSRQSEETQMEILGPTRLAAFRDDPSRVLDPGGAIRPVRRIRAA